MDNNSQVPDTPTVVLSLYEPKYVKFFKRYSDGKTFDNDSKETSEMLMNHGEFSSYIQMMRELSIGKY